MTIWEGTRRHNHGYINLATPQAINLETAGQYYKIPGTFEIFDHANFVANAAGVLTHNDIKGAYTLNGAADVEVNKASTVTFVLYRNGGAVPGAETPHTFAASSKISNLSITAIIHLLKGDYVEVYAKTDTANTLLTPATLRVTLFGARI